MKTILFYLVLSLITFAIGLSAAAIHKENELRKADMFICPA